MRTGWLRLLHEAADQRAGRIEDLQHDGRRPSGGHTGRRPAPCWDWDPQTGASVLRWLDSHLLQFPHCPARRAHNIFPSSDHDRRARPHVRKPRWPPPMVLSIPRDCWSVSHLAPRSCRHPETPCSRSLKCRRCGCPARPHVHVNQRPRLTDTMKQETRRAALPFASSCHCQASACNKIFGVTKAEVRIHDMDDRTRDRYRCKLRLHRRNTSVRLPGRTPESSERV